MRRLYSNQLARVYGYRHALALDAGGERLAFGSTTGGLWVSEDQGDSWTGVTHTLPPVYAVRFA